MSASTAEAVQRDTAVGHYQQWGYKAWDFDAFHKEELPKRLAKQDMLQEIQEDLGTSTPPFSICLTDGRAYTYSFTNGKVEIESGISDDATGVLEIGAQAWLDYVHELRNLHSLVLAYEVRFLRGGFPEWDHWAPTIRCMYSGRPIYDPNMQFLDRSGSPLDLHRTFTLDDDHEEMAHFLQTAGFIVVRGAMAHRRDEISEEIDRITSNETEDGIFSWWTEERNTGKRYPYRLLFMSEKSDLIWSLMDSDPTVKSLVSLAQCELVPLHDRGQGAITVLKPFGNAADPAPSIAADLGWHMDCELGGHPVMCPSINIGIHLDAAGPESSQLIVRAGTHDTVTRHPKSLFRDEPTVIALDTEPGDVTIHYSCALHAGPPAAGANKRRTVYLPFYRPDTLKLLGRFQSFEQVLPGYGTGNIPAFEDVIEELKAY